MLLLRTALGDYRAHLNLRSLVYRDVGLQANVQQEHAACLRLLRIRKNSQRELTQALWNH